MKILKIGELLVRQRFIPRWTKQVRQCFVWWPWRSRCGVVPTESAFFGRTNFGP